MKIFSSSEIRELDQQTIAREPVSSIDLMERAAVAMTGHIAGRWTADTPCVVFAGPGNNGGDALAIARLLGQKGWQTEVYLFNVHDKLSADCAANRARLDGAKGCQLHEVRDKFDPPELGAGTLVIDGLFGTGLNKPLAGGFAAVVKYINQSACTVVSVDMPSGLMAEDNTYNIAANIIRADHTLTLGQKKLCMLLADCQQYVGEVVVLDIGLSPEWIAAAEPDFIMNEAADIRPLLRPRPAFAHKGTMGHALLVAGSYGMAGAAVLAAKGCLRAGVGKLTVHTPCRNYDVIQIGIPEAVLHMDKNEAFFSEAVSVDDYDALGIGPGLGQRESTAIALIAQLRRATCPIVADADALNILAAHRAWMQQLPRGIILTPHPAELERLLGMACASDYERLTRARELAEHNGIYVLLKGHYSALCTPQGKVRFNSTGNPGMATAGSGDVLTGIITALLARGCSPYEACQLGMYLHGLAGDIAAEELGEESVMAGDIIACLPKAFLKLRMKN